MDFKLLELLRSMPDVKENLQQDHPTGILPNAGKVFTQKGSQRVELGVTYWQSLTAESSVHHEGQHVS